MVPLGAFIASASLDRSQPAVVRSRAHPCTYCAFANIAIMAADRSMKGKKRAGDASVHKYSKTPKKIKPELSTEEKLKKKWRSLKDQVNEGYLENAYKTSKRSES